MPNKQIGAFSIETVIEQDGPMFDPGHLLPDWSADVLDEHGDWLIPRHFDLDSGMLVAPIQSFLVKTPHHTIMVDGCFGNHKERLNPRFSQQDLPWLDHLKDTGTNPEDIDIVMCTHLHPDHVGWNTRLENGQWVPTYPNATYLFAETEWKHLEAENAAAAQPMAHFVDSVLPIIAAGQSKLVAMDHAIEDGIRFEPLPGHTPGHVGLTVEDRGVKSILIGDMIHHPLQLAFPDWCSAFCSDPALAIKTRRDFLERAAGTDLIVAPAHFPAPTFGLVERAGDVFRFRYDGE
ncbi:MAG: MBL fold metallo-hydrolase [Rhodospirillales bacterium]|nr:MBL fold metallo-hydrolase [Rhodospirillales bacterium]